MASMRRGSGAFVKACRPTLDPMARLRAIFVAEGVRRSGQQRVKQGITVAHEQTRSGERGEMLSFGAQIG